MHGMSWLRLSWSRHRYTWSRERWGTGLFGFSQDLTIYAIEVIRRLGFGCGDLSIHRPVSWSSLSETRFEEFYRQNKQDETTQLHSKVQTQLKTFGKALWEQVNVTANEFTLAEYSDPPITWVIPTLKRGLKVEICSRSRIRPFCSPLHAPDISNSQFSLDCRYRVL